MQVSQNLIFTEIPLTSTSLIRGNRNGGVCPAPTSTFPSKLSGSGGCAFRGIIPGSLPDVSSKRTKSWKRRNKHIYELEVLFQRKLHRFSEMPDKICKCQGGIFFVFVHVRHHLNLSKHGRTETAQVYYTL